MSKNTELTKLLIILIPTLVVVVLPFRFNTAFTDSVMNKIKLSNVHDASLTFVKCRAKVAKGNAGLSQFFPLGLSRFFGSF